MRRRSAVRVAKIVAQIGVLGVVAWYLVRYLARQWPDYRSVASTLHPSWPGLAASAVVVLATYALLVASWRMLLAAWDAQLPYWTAARIWAVSNLGRYVPGKVWSIGAMGVLAQRSGASPAAAAGAAILGTVINIGAGFAVGLATGGSAFAAMAGTSARLGHLLAIVSAVGLLASPFLIAPAATLAARALHRPIDFPPLRVAPLAAAVTANVASWFLYGVAFRLVALACYPSAGGGWLAYVAVYTLSYVLGYVAFALPGGIGVRETAMTSGLVALHLTSAPQALVLAVVSRLVLTVLELVPGLLFLARDAARRRHRAPVDAT